MSENFNIQKGGHVQFDAATINQHIKDRLNANSNNKFTDHNFEGSYISVLIETISYLYNVLMFYLNQTSTESKFTDAQLYENINRIVKSIGYSPVGVQTSLVPFNATTKRTDSNLYVVPRYSYLNVGGTTYSFNDDFSFRGNSIATATAGKMLYQGKFREYPLYTALGLSNEIVFLSAGDKVLIDHFNIHVYVKSKTGTWEQWKRVDTLVNNQATDKVYEVRFNENKRYELRFGNGINGLALAAEDSVAIYYLQTDGSGKEIAENIIDSNVKYISFASAQMTSILADLWVTNPRTVIEPSDVSFTNSVPSTLFSEAESVESIRNNAPDTVKRKLSVSKTGDYERIIRTSFPNLVSDVKVVNNFDYIKKYVNYFRGLGLSSVIDVSRALYSQVMFADSCNFNNMYIFIKPKIYNTTKSDYNKFLPSSAKQLILNEFEQLKVPTTEPVIIDPVYMAVGFGITNPANSVSIDDVDKSKLYIIRSKTSLRSDDVIKQDVADVVLNFFSQTNTTFGMYVDFAKLTADILGVNGVVDFRVGRTDSEYYYDGVSMIVWNPIYQTDVRSLLKSETFEDFQIPYLINRTTFVEKIEIVSE